MAKRGKMAWIPAVVIDEVEDIKREDNIDRDSEALKEVVRYARVGREAKRLACLDFSRSVPRVPVDAFGFKKKKRGLF